MIVPMEKFTFAVYHKDYDDFLHKLSNLGVVDIVQNNIEPNDIIKEKIATKAKLNDILKLLKSRNKPLIKKENLTDGVEVANKVIEINNNIDSLTQKANMLKKELELASSWGEYSTNIIRKLYDNNYLVRFFISEQKDFNNDWIENYNTFIINTLQSNIYFIIVQKIDEEIDIDANEIKIPEETPSQLRALLLETTSQIEIENLKLDKIATEDIEAINKSILKFNNELDYQYIVINTIKEVDEKLYILDGFVPITKTDNLLNFLNENGTVHFKERPVPDDNPPILLKNNKFSRLFEVITGMFSMPNYGEMDLTPFFAPFFMMFFGFCVGDFAYGAVLVLIGLFLRKRVAKSMIPILNLMFFLGLGTMIFGVITGTILGFKMVDFHIFDPIKSFMLDDQSVFYLALALGIVQILFGMCINAYAKATQFGLQYALSTIGVIIAFLCVLDLTIFKITGSIAQYVIYFGLFLMLFFSDPKVNIFVRVGKGVWDLYSAVTGIFGDVLSYVRLFALGISSSILGFVINDISMSIIGIAPVIGHILFIIVMIVGHSANMALAGLGAFVHPMRLTFVEFYKNAGFIGGGKKYKPYSNKIN